MNPIFDWMEPFEPVLDIEPESSKFALTMVKSSHFTFCVLPDPMASFTRCAGTATVTNCAIRPSSRPASVIYACQNGESTEIDHTRIDTFATARIEYVRSLTLQAFGEMVGVQHWAAIRIGRNADELLKDWPASISGQILFNPDEAVSDSALFHIGEWYEQVRPGHYALRGFVRP